MTIRQPIIEADLTWTGDRFERGVRIAIDALGDIAAVERGKGGATAVTRLPDRAILPGMVNAHSHAFQRALRGRGERFPVGRGSFWTWREEMYALVEAMDESSMRRWSKQAFDEMLACGITTVGEFHYLHHDASRRGFAFDRVVLEAASEAGIRIALLQCYYKTGAIGQLLEGGQRRFDTPSVAAFLDHVDSMRSAMDGRMHTLGFAPHSVRAVPLDDLVAIREAAKQRGLVCHMHVEEQAREVAECVERHGRTPMAIVNDLLSPDPSFTAIHCTQTTGDELHRYLDAGAHVCLCPLTEGNLGDGIASVRSMLDPNREAGRSQPDSICFGTDSNSRLSFVEEMRWVEYVQRLAHSERGLCTDGEGHVARRLFKWATEGGAAALNVRRGRIAPGHAADFFTLNLTHPSLEGWTDETLLDTWIFGAGNAAIGQVCVGSKWAILDSNQ